MTTIKGDDAIVVHTLEKVELAIRRTAGRLTDPNAQLILETLSSEIATVISRINNAPPR